MNSPRGGTYPLFLPTATEHDNAEEDNRDYRLSSSCYAVDNDEFHHLQVQYFLASYVGAPGRSELAI
jgi:hypothetical protein